MKHLARQARAEPVIIDGKLAGYALPTGEQVCIKQRYGTLEFAEQELSRIQGYAIGHHVPKRVYFCAFCRGFHMTSQNRVI